MEQTKKTRQEIEELFKSGVISKEEHDNLLEETRDHEQSHDKGIVQYFIPEIALLAIFVIPFALIFWITSSRYQQEELEEDCDSCCISSATSKDLDRSNDYLADDKGEPLLIDLGTFTDIQNFSEGAQRTFKNGIPIRVAVSKDLNRITIVDRVCTSYSYLTHNPGVYFFSPRDRSLAHNVRIPRPPQYRHAVPPTSQGMLPLAILSIYQQ